MPRRSRHWLIRPPWIQFAYEYDDRPGGLGNLFPGCGPRVLIALAIAAIALFKYFSVPTEHNSFTDREQRLHSTPQGEIRMGLAATPQMEAQYGGETPDANARATVERVGRKIVSATDVSRTPYQFNFHLLNDRKVVNAFALPGGQVFITEALYRLLKSDDELAGVLGHEIGHVVGRHSSEQMEKSELFGGLTTAFSVGMSGTSHGYDAARMAQFVNQMVNLRYSRGDESEADKLGVRFMMQTGYRPEAMIEVMKILKRVAGSGRQLEILSTHPDPENRIEHIQAEIERLRGQGR